MPIFTKKKNSFLYGNLEADYELGQKHGLTADGDAGQGPVGYNVEEFEKKTEKRDGEDPLDYASRISSLVPKELSDKQLGIVTGILTQIVKDYNSGTGSFAAPLTTKKEQISSNLDALKNIQARFDEEYKARTGTTQAKAQKEDETVELGKREEKITVESAQREADKTTQAIRLDGAQTANKMKLTEKQTIETIKTKEGELKAQADFSDDIARQQKVGEAEATLLGAGYAESINNSRKIWADKSESNRKILNNGLYVDAYIHAVKPSLYLNNGQSAPSWYDANQEAAAGNKPYDINYFEKLYPSANTFVYEDNNTLKEPVLYYNPLGDVPGGERHYGGALNRIVKMEERYLENGKMVYTGTLDNGEIVTVNHKQMMFKVDCAAEYYVSKDDAEQMELVGSVNNKTKEWMDSGLGNLLTRVCGGDERRALRILDAWNSPQGMFDKLIAVFSLIFSKDKGVDPESPSRLQKFVAPEISSDSKGVDGKPIDISAASQVVNQVLQVEALPKPLALGNSVYDKGEGIVVTKDEADKFMAAFGYNATAAKASVKGRANWDKTVDAIFTGDMFVDGKLYLTNEGITVQEHLGRQQVLQNVLDSQKNIVVSALQLESGGSKITLNKEEIDKIKGAFGNREEFEKFGQGISGWDVLAKVIYDPNFEDVDYIKSKQITSLAAISKKIEAITLH